MQRIQEEQQQDQTTVSTKLFSSSKYDKQKHRTPLIPQSSGIHRDCRCIHLLPSGIRRWQTIQHDKDLSLQQNKTKQTEEPISYHLTTVVL